MTLSQFATTFQLSLDTFSRVMIFSNSSMNLSNAMSLSLIFLDRTPECTPNVAQNRIVRRSLDHIESVDGEVDVVLTKEPAGSLLAPS